MRHFPLFSLRITTPRLELRFPTLEDLDDLAERAAEGVHDEGVMPFLMPWTDTTPDKRALSTIRYHFGKWAEITPEKWTCPFVVIGDGQVAGTQEVWATDFAVTREVATGSWLGRRFQGQGIGTEMRAAVLQFAFEGLGADHAVSGAFEDNHASLAVSRKLGYRDDGVELYNRQGRRATSRRLRLAREDWTPRPDIEIHGLEPCLPLLGVTPPESAS
ncbi:GNAT family N-acetyltransferase [Thermoactinospora rubra]|uniref:GNAT family N-acetyltransferase n=1 Tax=Thermoactinospora rubra TaxID=1088767 RepID=UPI000A106C38|nr:GNAT family protein [Thermoactinospora rubra]